MKHSTALENLENAERLSQRPSIIKQIIASLVGGAILGAACFGLYKGFLYAIGPSEELLTYNKLHSECMKKYPHWVGNNTYNMAMSNMCDKEVKTMMKERLDK